MYYVIDRVRWNANAELEALCWHMVEFRDDRLVDGPSHEVKVTEAAGICGEHEVRVYAPGDTGQFFKMRACAAGIEPEPDEVRTSIRKRLAHLPTF